ncbi:class I adenylate cyclase, partial [Klebsiella pneumoniae]|uniref:class I adenylate cyclase n=1 Tax=Klebsiella pneumoniae TaxID=573 RepID=UPI00210B09DE
LDTFVQRPASPLAFHRAEVYHHCEGSKEELVRDVSRFYSSSHDRFTYGSSFINFNLPQFYQIVEVASGRDRSLREKVLEGRKGRDMSPLLAHP